MTSPPCPSCSRRPPSSRARSQVVTEEIDGGTITFLDGEAVALVDGLVHHLDPTATGLWILATEGLSAGRDR